VPELTLLNAKEVILQAPPGGVLKSVRVSVEIEPADGAALIYGAPEYQTPIRVEGPSREVDILTTEPKVYVQKISGATSVNITTLSWTEDRSL